MLNNQFCNEKYKIVLNTPHSNARGGEGGGLIRQKCCMFLMSIIRFANLFSIIFIINKSIPKYCSHGLSLPSKAENIIFPGNIIFPENVIFPENIIFPNPANTKEPLKPLSKSSLRISYFNTHLERSTLLTKSYDHFRQNCPNNLRPLAAPKLISVYQSQ